MKSHRKRASAPRRNFFIVALLPLAIAFFPNCGGDSDGDGDGNGKGGASGANGGGGGSGGSNGASGKANGGSGGGGSGGSSGGGVGSGGGAGMTPTPSPDGTLWTLGQSLTKNWDAGSPNWDGGNTVTFDNVEAGSTLVLCAYGYTYPNVPFSDPTDSAGQPVEIAVDVGVERAVQAKAWVLHNASAGAHTWSQLPDLTTGDGKLFFAEFRHEGYPSTTVLAQGTQTLDAYEPPWLTTGSVTMSTGANQGDLLVAFSFQEESSVGNPNTPYTDPPDGWGSLGVQNQSKVNIAGEACWRTAPDTSPLSVAWSWTLVGDQDPTLFKAAIFAIHAP
jgi:hypothetical protein